MDRNCERIEVPRIDDLESAIRALVRSGPYPVYFWRAPQSSDRMMGFGLANRVPLGRDTLPDPSLTELLDLFDGAIVLYALPFDSTRGSEPSSLQGWIPELLYRENGHDAEVVLCGGKGRRQELLDLFRLRCEEEFSPGEPDAPLRLVSDEDAYRSQVRRGIELIRSGELEKIVLARKAIIESATGMDAVQAWARLDRTHPDCYSILFAKAPDDVFLSATPERLASVAGGRFDSAAVAGTASLSAGEAQAVQELSSPKNMREHAFVVDMIHRTAMDLCDAVEVGETVVRHLRGYAHLTTAIRGSLRAGRSILDAVSALHPTPAVAGTPRETAMRLISAIEGFDRGLYAGVSGWADARGDGEAAVTIRSVQFVRNSASAFAGAGIVGNSIPDDENEETRLKLRPVLRALGIPAEVAG